LLLAAQPALADFRVCNTTRVMANLAVGHAAGDDFATEGWWTVAPGDCATPVRGALTGRYLYVYAVGVDSRELFPGTVSMCVDRVKFKVTGVADCWRRGLMSVAFYEIDTGSAADWTTFLGDAGK
jgi:uncharacterized membrane protein